MKLGNHDGPAGPIVGVLEIQYRAIGCADVGPLQEQYADHLGMLGRVVSTIAGPRTFDLIAARVGNITIHAAPSASFNVSLGPTTGTGPVLATFRLHVNSKLPLTLSFSSGQEYDFALKDSAGTTLWTWSASQTFLQAPHQRIVADEWSATDEIPWPTTSAGVSPARRLHRGGGGHKRQPRAVRRDGSGDDRYALDFGRHRPPVKQGN